MSSSVIHRVVVVADEAQNRIRFERVAAARHEADTEAFSRSGFKSRLFAVDHKKRNGNEKQGHGRDAVTGKLFHD